MASFLSDEWLAELAEALRAEPGLSEGPALALGQVVTGTPALEGAEVAYTLRLGGGSPAAVVPGTVEDADVVLVEDYETARQIASGTPAAALLSAGRLKVRGDANALIAAQEQLGSLGDALAELAATTHFEPAGAEEEPAGQGAVIEHALITVEPGREAAFVAAFPEGRAVISSADGCRSVRLLQGVESPQQFLLLVEWESLEHHTVGFRGSPLFGEWREIVGPFLAEPPAVEHFRPAD